MNQTVLHNSDPSVVDGFYILDSIKPQYVGGSSVNIDARTNMFSNVKSNNLAFDGLLQSVVHSSSQNIDQNIDRQQSTLQEGQYRSSVANSTGFPILVNDVQPIFCNTQRLNCETHRQRRVIRSAPSQRAQQIPLQSNGYKIQLLKISSNNCSGLTCGLCGPTSFCTESRKRKYAYEPPSYECESDNGTLIDVLNGFLNSYVPDRVSQELSSAMSKQPLYGRLPPLEQYSDKSEDVLVVKSQHLDVASGSKVNNIITKDASCFKENTGDRKGESSQVGSKVIICNTFAELLTSVNTSIEAENLVFNEMPNVEQCSNSSEDVTMDSSPKGNNLVKGHEGNDDNPSAELKGPPKVNICSTSTDLLTSSYVNTYVESEDLVFPEMPNLEQRSNSSEDVIMVLSPAGNNLLKDTDDTTSDELKEPPKLNFEEKTSDEKLESSQLNLNVICGFNTTADDYESLLESMQSTTPTSVLESYHTKSETKSRNIKCPSASLANSFTASQIKEHLSSFIQPNKEITPSSSQNMCQLCSMDKLPLAPPPMYCSACDLRIRQDVFVRDFVPSALAFLMNGKPEIVKNFLLKTVFLQSREKKVDNFKLAKGVMPASFKVIHDNDRNTESLLGDYGDTAIGRVAPVDSGFWWIILLRAYTKSTGDTSLAKLPECQKAIRLIMTLCLSEGFDTFPTLLCADGCCMIDRRMGVYGYPIEIQTLFFMALKCALLLLKHDAKSSDCIDGIVQRLQALSFHMRSYFWLDFKQLTNIRRYKTEEYSHTAVNKFNVFPDSLPSWVFGFMPRTGGYFIGNVGPSRKDFRWFCLGNCMAILSSLATPEQSCAIMDLIEARWEELVGQMPLKICYPAMESHEWEFVTGCDPKNTSWSYHNGGSWPVLIWLLTAASIKAGRPEIAKRAIEVAEGRLMMDQWPEYYDGKLGRYIGKQARKNQTWSIAGYLVAKMMLEDPSHLDMISLGEEIHMESPIKRSASWAC